MEANARWFDLYRSFFMRDRVGDVLDGTSQGGQFGALWQRITFCRGAVRTEHLLPDDFYDYDEWPVAWWAGDRPYLLLVMQSR